MYVYNFGSYLSENILCITASRCLLFKETTYMNYVNTRHGNKYRVFYILNVAVRTVITDKAHGEFRLNQGT